MALTYQINGVTTIQVDIFDAVRNLSMVRYSAEEGRFTVENGTSSCIRN
jgi:hypothetical protein